MMKNKQIRRSNCPVNFALETFGDMWSLLIIRDMVYFGKKTYGEFLNSEEGIATNILANRLSTLEQNGILVKSPDPSDRRKEIYALTEKGLDLIPVVLEMTAWSAHYDPLTTAPKSVLATWAADKANMTQIIRATVKSGGSVFVGPNSVISKINH